jgi:hypothetical protein
VRFQAARQFQPNILSGGISGFVFSAAPISNPFRRVESPNRCAACDLKNSRRFAEQRYGYDDCNHGIDIAEYGRFCPLTFLSTGQYKQQHIPAYGIPRVTKAAVPPKFAPPTIIPLKKHTGGRPVFWVMKLSCPAGKARPP